MAAAAEFALIHLLHHPAFIGTSGRNDGIMAITAAIAFSKVRFMAELNVSGTGGKLISDRTRITGMALRTTGLYPESRFIIMATAARFALFHLAHCEMFITGTRNVKIGMAILAAIGGDMYRVAKFGAAGAEMDLFDSMAFLAVRFYTKSSFSIMATAAGLSLFHVSHAEPNTIFTGFENLIVALTTFIHALMVGMVKNCVTCLPDLENNIDGRFMTSITITLYTEHRRSVMAAAAGRTFFHLRHGKSSVAGAGAIQFVMAIGTRVYCQMFIMAEAGII